MQAVLLRLHRWVALLFALPLAVVLLTGLVLSFEPWLITRSIKPGSLTVEKVEALLKQHDPSGRAAAIAYRSYDDTVSIGGRRDSVTVSVSTGEKLAGPSGMASFLVTMRRMHETLLLDLGWLVVASTIAMLVLAALGILMGLPRFSNTLSGWHKAMSWGLLPLVVLSPLTGLAIAWGITFQPPRSPPGEGAKPLALIEAVRTLSRTHDLSTLIWLRPQGGAMAARVVDAGGEFRVYRVTSAGAVATSRNWPRAIHEGNFAGGWSALMNVVTSFALVGLLITGVWIWLRRTLRRRARRAEKAAALATT